VQRTAKQEWSYKMLDKMREMMEEAQSHAKRCDEFSATLAK
jgi:hypothetical protein